MRADSGVRAGDAISPFYDPMIAKIIAHGPTRAVALRRLGAALAATEVAGTVTNLAFLGALARHEGFAAGDVDTGLIERDLEALTREPAAAARGAWRSRRWRARAARGRRRVRGLHPLDAAGPAGRARRWSGGGGGAW